MLDSLRDRIAWHRREAGECEAAEQESAAIWHLDRLIEAEPSNGASHRQRAKVHNVLGHLDKAVADYSKAIELKPDDAETWLLRGGLYVQLKQWAKGLADYSKAIELKPDYWQAWDARGLLYAQQEDWGKAAADFAKSTGEPRALWLRSGWHALALAGAGDKVGHRDACAALLQEFGDTETPNIANDVAWFCVRFPDAVNDPARPLQLAEMAVAKNPKSHPYLNTLGAALYRANRFEDSIERFDEAIKAHGQGGHPVDWLFLAMAHHRLGHTGEAKRWMEKSQQRLDQFSREKSKDATTTANPLSWDQRLELKLILTEAETLIKMEKKQK